MRAHATHPMSAIATAPASRVGGGASVAFVGTASGSPIAVITRPPVSTLDRSQPLMMTVRAEALLEGRLVPTVEDVARMAIPVLTHRMQLTFAARARGESLQAVIEQVTAEVTRTEAAA